jgi:hypothetical protein
MKTAQPSPRSRKGTQGQLGRGLPRHRSEPIGLSAPTALIPAEPLGRRQKRHLTPGACPTPPHPSDILSATPRYKPQIEKPGSFNPELCGGLRGSETPAG